MRPAYADKAAEVIAPVVDPVPWVAAGRDPTEVESFAAILSTVVLLAAQRVGTGARGVASKRQEAEVAALLEAVDFDFDAAARESKFWTTWRAAHSVGSVASAEPSAMSRSV